METTKRKAITVETTVKSPVENIWKLWSEPKHITKWCNASDDWHAPHAENDLRTGGRFKTTMAAKDGSTSFDFGGEYTTVQKNKLIGYTMDDGRKATVEFTSKVPETKISETFEMEGMNPEEMQRGGWQAILDNFKKYAEANS